MATIAAKRSRESIEPKTVEECDKLIAEREQRLVRQKEMNLLAFKEVQFTESVKCKRAKLAALHAEFNDNKQEMDAYNAEVKRMEHIRNVAMNIRAADNELSELTISCEIMALQIEKKKLLASQQIPN
jgi:hypothetical protein